ncbi:MAG: GntR family transcriptional regulator [Clostridiales bacterium]|nr:GntR family transcriptional regulator [Clostridiales bacterium]
MEYQEQSLSGQIFNKIREDILSGTFAQGEELKEATLGKKLGVSRTPVREALRQLELEGLVEIIPNRGARVTGISEKDIADIYGMRSRLEGLAARWAAEHISEEEIAEMEEVILLSEFHLKNSKKDQVVRLDGRFHEIMYRAAGSRMLEHILTDFHHYVKIARSTSVKAKKRAEESVEEHRAILDAIRKRDEVLAEKLANEHIQHVIENLDMKI